MQQMALHNVIVKALYACEDPSHMECKTYELENLDDVYGHANMENSDVIIPHKRRRDRKRIESGSYSTEIETAIQIGSQVILQVM